jgi:hypothetical protein
MAASAMCCMLHAAPASVSYPPFLSNPAAPQQRAFIRPSVTGLGIDTLDPRTKPLRGNGACG